MPDRLAILTSHPIQYYAPLFREIARRIDVKVFFAHAATAKQQGEAGFGVAFDWDLDLLDGYPYEFLRNVASDPSAQHFFGCDTPEIGEKIAAGRFTALLVTGWHLKSYWQGIRGAKRYDIPVMVRGDSHLGNSTDPGKRLVKGAAYPFLLRLFDAALYVGQRNRAYYERYRYPEERLFHSPHCVDTARFSGGAGPESRAALRARLGIGANVKCVLFAGKLIDFKRPLDVIEAAALVRAKRHHLVHVTFAGSGPLEAEARARAEALHVPLYVLGFQNQTQMPAAYAAADVLVLPSTRETWGLVCNEALACGTPIIVSDAVGCAPDLAADGSVGRMFPVANVAALAEAITATLCAPPSAEAIRRISGRHGLPAAVAGISAALQALPNRRMPCNKNVPVSLT